jgi:hypothetical protein
MGVLLSYRAVNDVYPSLEIPQTMYYEPIGKCGKGSESENRELTRRLSGKSRLRGLPRNDGETYTG